MAAPAQPMAAMPPDAAHAATPSDEAGAPSIRRPAACPRPL